MKIGIDVKNLHAGAAGIGRYTRCLLHAMLPLAAAEAPELRFFLISGPQVTRGALESLGGGAEEWRSAVRSSVLRGLGPVPHAIRSLGLDVFHGLDHAGLPVRTYRAKGVVTLHDLLPISRPEFFTLKHRLVVRALLPAAVRRAHVVIVPTRAVRAAAVARLRLREAAVVVVPEGCEPRFRPEPDPAAEARVRERYRLPERYLLTVGTLEPRKNHAALLEAYARLGERLAPQRPPALVVAGMPGWGAGPIFRRIETHPLRESIHRLGFVEDQDLPHLYRGATAFAFPSHDEGFGLPVLEAMASGVPVVASTAPALAEVSGKAAVLVGAEEAEALAEALALLLCDEGERTARIEAGLARAREFTWERTARRTLEVYRSLLS
jgi:glycosyltransferase involved in cell wall biosynthesis